jgi:hypothetical protein
MKNPTMIYRAGTMLVLDAGHFDYIIVDESQVEMHLAKGWSKSPTLDALDKKAPTRAELEEKARDLQIKFDGRTSDGKLAANIEAALNGLDKA